MNDILFPYSRITHWAKVLFLKPDSLMAMFMTYFDESGGEDTPAFSVAGYVSAVEQWERFEREWNEILANEEISIFHMVDFNQSVGEFSRFKNKPEEAERFLDALVCKVKNRARMSFACILSPSDYLAVNNEFELEERLGNWYSFCSRYCVAAVRRWAERYGHPKDEILYVFENGCKGKGYLYDIMERDGFPPPTFGDKKIPPLQAADLVAWQLRRLTGMAYRGILQSFPGPFETLSKMPLEWGVYKNKQDLEDFCSKTGMPRRLSPAIPAAPTSGL